MEKIKRLTEKEVLGSFEFSVVSLVRNGWTYKRINEKLNDDQRRYSESVGWGWNQKDYKEYRVKELYERALGKLERYRLLFKKIEDGIDISKIFLEDLFNIWGSEYHIGIKKIDSLTAAGLITVGDLLEFIDLWVKKDGISHGRKKMKWVSRKTFVNLKKILANVYSEED